MNLNNNKQNHIYRPNSQYTAAAEEWNAFITELMNLISYFGIDPDGENLHQIAEALIAAFYTKDYMDYNFARKVIVQQAQYASVAVNDILTDVFVARIPNPQSSDENLTWGDYTIAWGGENVITISGGDLIQSHNLYDNGLWAADFTDGALTWQKLNYKLSVATAATITEVSGSIFQKQTQAEITRTLTDVDNDLTTLNAASEKIANRSTGIDGASTNLTYPTTKAVYDFVIAAVVGDVDYQGTFKYFGVQADIVAIPLYDATTAPDGVQEGDTAIVSDALEKGVFTDGQWAFTPLDPAPENGMFANIIHDLNYNYQGAMVYYKNDGVNPQVWDEIPQRFYMPDEATLTLNAQSKMAIKDMTLQSTITPDIVPFTAGTTITWLNFYKAIASKINGLIGALAGKISNTLIDAANGVAGLDANGRLCRQTAQGLTTYTTTLPTGGTAGVDYAITIPNNYQPEIGEIIQVKLHTNAISASAYNLYINGTKYILNNFGRPNRAGLQFFSKANQSFLNLGIPIRLKALEINGKKVLATLDNYIVDIGNGYVGGNPVSIYDGGSGKRSFTAESIVIGNGNSALKELVGTSADANKAVYWDGQKFVLAAGLAPQTATTYNHTINLKFGSEAHFDFVSTRATQYTSVSQLASDLYASGATTRELGAGGAAYISGSSSITYSMYSPDGVNLWVFGTGNYNSNITNSVVEITDRITQLSGIGEVNTRTIINPRGTFTTLWEGSLQAAGTIQLSDSIQNYDEIHFEVTDNDETFININNTFQIDAWNRAIAKARSNGKDIMLREGGGWGKISSNSTDTSIILLSESYFGITGVYGFKYNTESE
jgi:hypothetical protein